MAEFSIRFSDVENSIEILSHNAVELRQIQKELTSARKNLRALGSATYRINSILNRIERSVMNKALSMDSLSDALEEISAYYRSAESRIVSGSMDTADDIRDLPEQIREKVISFLNSIRDILVSWGIVKAERQTRTPGEAVTEAQEREMDLYLQSEIENILEKDRYSQSTWKNASVEERKEILNEYLQEVAAVMGLQIGEINYTYTEASNGTYNMGSYSPSTNMISINEWVLENGGKNNIQDSYNLMYTIAHEMRHAYQHAACSNPEQFVVTEETIQSWQESIDNYRSQRGFMQEGMNAEEAYNAYRNQTIERDARWFAGQD